MRIRAQLVEALAEVGAHAVEVGSVVYLEPLNRYEDFVVNLWPTRCRSLPRSTRPESP